MQDGLAPLLLQDLGEPTVRGWIRQIDAVRPDPTLESSRDAQVETDDPRGIGHAIRDVEADEAA